MSQPARFCIRCGAAVPVADSRFCFSCGAEIVSPGLIAEDSQMPAQEPHEEPPAAPPPSSNLDTEPQGGGIDPIQAVVSGFTRCMELGGRSSRSEFWWFYLFTGSAFLLTLVMAGLIGAVVGAGGAVACISLNILVLWPYIAVGVRRLHDSGRGGWLILIGLVPGFGWIALLILWASPSDQGSNRYGPNPNQRTQNPQQTPDSEHPSAGRPSPDTETISAALLAMVGETPIAQEPTPAQIPPYVHGDESTQKPFNWPAWISVGVLVVVLVAASVVMIALS